MMMAVRLSHALVGLAVLISGLGSEPPPPPDVRFGAIEAYMDPARAADLRVGWDRMIIRWAERQPDQPGQWNVSAEEADRVAAAQAAGREVVALLMATPAWATDVPLLGGVPRGLRLPVDDPGNLWAAFVRRIVAEYAGRIDHWIIWNEPDIAPEDFGAQFEGTVEDYYQLVKVAFQAAKAVNPRATIHLAGLTHWHDVVHGRPPYLERFLAVASRDPSARFNRYYFDVVTLHIYFRSETVYDLIAFYRGVLRRYGLRQPIWLNETNSAPYDDPQLPWNAPMFPVTMAQQAAFVVQANALALAAGAERIAVYKLTEYHVPNPGGDYYGLFRPDGSARPAAEAFRVVTTHFAGVRRTSVVARPLYYLVRLDRGSAVTRVLWARLDRDYSLRLYRTPGLVDAVLLDALGHAQPIIPDRHGYFHLTLPAAACDPAAGGCVVGGQPWILVETLRK